MIKVAGGDHGNNLEEISKIVERLSLDRQQKVLEFVQKLTQIDQISTPLSLPTTPLPPGTPGSTLLQLHFLSSWENVEAMERALEDHRLLQEIR